jgi:signal recognition particle receptor subunit beta
VNRSLKIVVSGPFGAGKTRFIKTISEIDVVTTERKITHREKGMKRVTTVAMDFGRVTLGEDSLYLYGTPGQIRFEFMWDILSREMAGVVMLVDSTDPESFPHARELIDEFIADRAVPYVVAANKQDLEGASPIARLRRAMNLSADVLAMPCVASRKTSVRQVLSQLAQII